MLKAILKSGNKYMAFYGKVLTVIYLDQYVQLRTLEEYFNELPGQAN
ncbi:MAG: hypothetical protein WC780_05325 [Lentimicrobiaceae bacterium]|jgi:hypothetical protein